jgi:guanine deaminase
MTPPIELIRAAIFHTPRNPFATDHALEAFADGCLAISAERVVQLGDYAAVRAQHPDAQVHDWRGSMVLPGLIDAHTHFPQTRIIGGLGLRLLDWLRSYALPEELRMADADYARAVAQQFTRELARHGTTTALVFGAHFESATQALFEAAAARGIRIATGLVFSDRELPAGLLRKPDDAYHAANRLIAQFHGRNHARYAVTPRFALSTSEEMLEICATLMREHPGVLFQTHLNENFEEIAAVRRAFRWADTYTAVYDRFSLLGPQSTFAHSVHPTAAELSRLAATDSSVAHCPCSNAMLGSGMFPMRRHLTAGVKFALGTDVGAGIGFGVLKEALHSYLTQQSMPEGAALSPAHLLYLATRAGALALGLGDECGDFSSGKSADLVRFQPPQDAPLAHALARAESPERMLAALITQAGPETVREVRVAGRALSL